MKKKPVLIIAFGLLVCSCATPGFLPDPGNVDCNEHGAYIKVSFNDPSSPVQGELIVANFDSIVVLVASGKGHDRKCQVVRTGKIYRYSLRYARPGHYGWTIPLFSVATITHGWFLIFTFPVNLITTIAVTVSGERSYKYTEQDLAPEKLKIYARFPQGIPPGVKLTDIR